MLGMLLAFALILAYVESLLPLPFGVPGMKLGLPNLAVLLVLYRFGGKEALSVNLARVVLSGFLFGNFASILYSLSGALLSFFIMSVCKKGKRFGVVGVSVAGGCAHNLAQAAVAAMVTSTGQIFYYLPPLIVCGSLTGFGLGLAARGVLARLPGSAGKEG